MASPLLILIHIPKTAGTTLSRMIRLRLALWPPSHWLHHADVLGHYHAGYSSPRDIQRRCEMIRHLPELSQKRMRFVAAHAGYGLHELLPDPQRACYITMLREPVARVISTYHFLRGEKSIPQSMTLEQFAGCGKHYLPFYVDNAQVRFLAGERGRVINVSSGACTRKMLDLALARLERNIALAGLTERFNESVLLLGRMLGWRRPLYTSARVTGHRHPSMRPNDAAVELIRSRNQFDQILYDRAAELLDARIRSAGPEFTDQARQFARINRGYDRLMGPVVNILPFARQALQRMHVIR